MGRQKGTPKTGGRMIGTPNKITNSLKQFISELIDGNRKQIEDDLKALKPYQRLAIIERLLGYVLPKQQAVSPEGILEAEYRQLERLIDTLPDEAIDRITEKILEMQTAKQHEQQEFTEEGY